MWMYYLIGGAVVLVLGQVVWWMVERVREPVTYADTGVSDAWLRTNAYNKRGVQL